MKTSIQVLVIIALIAAVIGQIDTKEGNKSILEANLAVAFSLDERVISTCGDVTFDYGSNTSKAPVFNGLGNHTFAITTKNEEAQMYFNQGLNLAFGFNHSEAHRSFKQASELSPESAMTYWGQAYALSPNINDSELDDERRVAALEAIESAVAIAKNVTRLEMALINAMKSRFIKNEDGSIVVDNETYMAEMKVVTSDFADNADVLTLYAEAIMNTMPWNYWEKDSNPRPNTSEAKTALERAITINPLHPGAHHYYIHLTELPFPELAAKSGDALAPLMPGAGHMVHMPSHAYIRVGRYKDAAEANLKAILVDEDYISLCYSQGVYPLGYYPHNIHFLWYAGTFLGDSKTALAAARKTGEKVSIGLMNENVFMQEFAAVPIQSYVRFGKWNEVLTIPFPGNNLKHLKLFWHYGRGMAFIRKGILIEAKEELDSLKKMSEDESYRALYASLNSSDIIANLAYNLVSGEYMAVIGNSVMAKDHFQKAVELEDQLTYTEPPSWHMSTRLNYGKFLLDQGEYKIAERVYQEDVKKWGPSGWSLIGLREAYNGLGERTKSKEAQKQFLASWKYSDVRIDSSVF